jgi:hypothetical protein
LGVLEAKKEITVITQVESDDETENYNEIKENATLTTISLK